MSNSPGLRKRGSLVVRLSLVLMVALFLMASAYRLLTHHHQVVRVTAPVTEFFASPDQVSCEFDHNLLGSSTTWRIYCVYNNGNRTENVTMSDSGTIHTCTGSACGSNAGLFTPTYGVGTRVIGGPITCLVVAHGASCSLASGVGFTLTSKSLRRLHP